MTLTEAAEVDKQISPWSLDLDHRFTTPQGKVTGVVLSKKGSQYIASMLSGAKLWSGPSPRYFIEKFWEYKFQ